MDCKINREIKRDTTKSGGGKQRHKIAVMMTKLKVYRK